MAIVGIALVAFFSACGYHKPNGSVYLGHWEGTATGGLGYKIPCLMEISKIGESYLVKGMDDKRQPCSIFMGVYILTPEGNLRGGVMNAAVFSFDKENNRLIFSLNGDVEILKKH